MSGNQWELIYKHIAFILYNKNEVDKANEFIEKLEEVFFIKKLNNADEVTIKLINASRLFQAYKFNKNERMNTKASKEMEQLCISREILRIIFKKVFNSENESDRIKSFTDKFKFMFN